MNPEHLLDESAENTTPDSAWGHQEAMRETSQDTRLDISACLYALAHDFEEARRCGADNDAPEGIRYIVLSDTLFQNIIERLQKIADILTKNPSVLLVRDITPEQVERWKQWWEKETGGIFDKTIKIESGLD